MKDHPSKFPFPKPGKFHLDPTEPIEPFDPSVPPPPPDTPGFPDPWPPIFAIHLYGMNWDFESLEQSSPTNWAVLRRSIETFFDSTVRGALHLGTSSHSSYSVEFAFDGSFPGTSGPIPVLSIGAWGGATQNAGPTPTSNPGREARKRGLRASRTPGAKPSSGEIQIAVAFINELIRAKVPGHLIDKDSLFEATLVSTTVMPRNPAAFDIGVTYGAILPLLGYNEVGASTSLEFAAAGGNLDISNTPLQFSVPQFGSLILDVLTGMIPTIGSLLFSVGGVGMAYMEIQNLGSGRTTNIDLSSLVKLGIPGTSGLRDLMIGPIRLHLNFLPPGFVGGLATRSGTLSIPFNFAFLLRQPSASIHCSTAVNLFDNGPRTLVARAFSSDLDNPTYTWTLDQQPAGSGQTIYLDLLPNHGQRIGAKKTFHIGVVAVDGSDPTITASARINVVGTLHHHIDP